MSTPTVETIEEIKRLKAEIRELRKQIKPADYGGQRFGTEDEYTIQSILSTLDKLMVDISALIRAPAKFRNMSSYAERTELIEHMSGLAANMRVGHIPSIVDWLEAFKPLVVKYGISYQPKRLAERLEAFDSAIDAFQQKTTSYEETIEGFSEKVSQREAQLEDQEIRTKNYEKKLKNLEDNGDKLQKKAEDLIKSAQKALEYKTAEGLSASFAAQYDEAKSGFSKGAWIVVSGLFTIAAVGIGVWVFLDAGVSMGSVWGRLSLIPILIGAAWFCAGQYVKLKNIAEDYAYKAALAKSLVGFSGFRDCARNDRRECTPSNRDCLDRVV